jgi:glycosyltransferase involved in cell wall biosynthesis
MEKHIMRLSQEQRNKGHEVSIAYNSGNSTSEDDIHIKSRLKLKGMRPQSLRDAIFYLSLIFHVVRNKLEFDVVHIHGAWSAFIFGPVITKFCRGKVLVGSVHDGINKGRFWQLIYTTILNKFNFIYSTGNKDAEFLDSIIEAKVYWRSSGIDKNFFLNENGNVRDIDVISVGSFVQRKNQLLILEIAKKMPDLNFTLVGDGPLFDTIKALSEKDNILNVQFLGSLSYEEVALVLKRSKIFLMTSFSEGTPTALLESMAAGNVVVTSNSNDFSSVIEDATSGYIIDNFDTSNYVKVVNELIDEPDKWSRMSKNNTNDAKLFSWPQVESDITKWMTDEFKERT